MKLARLAIPLLVGATLATTVVDTSCTPAQRESAAPIVPAAVQAGCILFRAVMQDGRVDEVCATVEDLAPIFGELLAAHNANADAGAPEAKPLLAFTIPASTVKKAAPRRRCAQWVSTADAGAEVDSGR